MIPVVEISLALEELQSTKIWLLIVMTPVH